MIKTISPSPLIGTVDSIASKSSLQRLLLCAALADGETVIATEGTGDDIAAFIGCIRSIGCDVSHRDRMLRITPPDTHTGTLIFDLRDNGTAARFFIPVAAALFDRAAFLASGRLPNRPLGELLNKMTGHGVTFDNDRLPLCMSGRLLPGAYTLSGKVSSQFASGLLFALPLLEKSSTIVFSSPPESAGYIDMTIDALSLYGVKTETFNGEIYVEGNQSYKAPKQVLSVGGDWSSAAVWLAAGVLNGKIDCTGLDRSSKQPDRAIAEILSRMGGYIEFDGKTISARSGYSLSGITFDASQCPDTVPLVAAVAASAEGITRIIGASRLALQESDRLQATAAMIKSLGGNATVTGDGLVIKGTRLKGGVVDCCADHRIAMAAMVASRAAEGEVTLLGAECVGKSYPDFWRDYHALGGK